MLAIRHAAQVTNHIKTDSTWCINPLCGGLSNLEGTDSVDSLIGEIINNTVDTLRVRLCIPCLEWIKGHAGILGNERADELVAQGARSPNRTQAPHPLEHESTSTLFHR